MMRQISLQRMFFFMFLVFSVTLGQPTISQLQQSLGDRASLSDFGNSKVSMPMVNTLDSISDQRNGYSDFPLTNQNNSTIIDKKIDPQQYTLGSGDALYIYIWGSTEKKMQLIIDAEGIVILPLMGPVTLSGKTLSQAKQELSDKISRVYKNTQCVVELTSIRQFKVYLTGNVVKPGSYIVNPVTRVSEVIMAAGGITKEGKVRGIIVKNDTSAISELDLLTFFNNNDISKNPYLKEGDQVFVPFKKEKVSISGSVSHPGQYDFCKGDNLKSIITAASGFSREADTSKIIITRFLNNFDSLETLEVGFPEGSKTEIKPDDRILVTSIPKYREFRQVYITGEVVYPGLYPIRADKTTLREIIKAAGGLTSQASLHTSKIIRKNHLLTGNREYDRIKSVQFNMLNPLEMSYLKFRTKEDEGLISIDFDKLYSSTTNLSDFILRENDELTIARKELSIKVSGAVSSPGQISFISGKNVDYFVQQAGGLLPSAQKKKIAIIKGGTNTFRLAKGVKRLDAGDVIVVPEKKYQDGMTFTKDVLVIIGSVATIALSLFTVSSYLGSH